MRSVQKQAAMLGKALLRDEDVMHLQNGKLEIWAVLKYFCKKGMP